MQNDFFSTIVNDATNGDFNNPVNIPTSIFKFPDGKPLVGEFVREEIVKQIKNEVTKATGEVKEINADFETYIFKQLPDKKFVSIAGKGLKDKLTPGNVYLIFPPEKKTFKNKHGVTCNFNDFPVDDVTNKYREYQKGQSPKK